MLDGQLPGQWKAYNTSITAGNTTLAKILVDESQPRILPAITGETALPGETAVRQRVLTGGQRIIDGNICSTDGTARSALIYIGTVLTRQANMGAASITGTNTINRDVGSFLTDGWKVGDTLMPFDMLTAANNGVVAQITAVTAIAITVNGTPFSNETLPAGARLARISRRTQRAIAINAGNADATPPVQLIGGQQDPSAFQPPDAGIALGKDDIIAVAAVATISALPARLDFHAIGALY